MKKVENMPVKKKVPVKISEKPTKNAREKIFCPWNFSSNATRETEICTREKIKTVRPWKGKSARENHNT